MQLELYTSLVLALPEGDLAHIEETDDKDPKCDSLAWQALTSHWESCGLYKRADLQKSLQEAQQNAEIVVQFLNRLLRLKNKLARVGETVSDDTIMMHLVARLRDEYYSITDTWDESTMTLEKNKTDLKVKAVRVEQRMAREHSSKSSGFHASTTSSMSMDQLQRRVAELEGMVASTKAPIFGSSGSRGNTRQPCGRIFRGVCYGCGERGHRRNKCVKRVVSHHSANHVAAARAIDEDHNPIAFPATITVRSWVDVVRQEIQPTCYIVTNDLVMLRGNDTCFATFIAETPCSTSQEKYARWCANSGTSDHMTNCKADFFNFKHAPKIWVKGICAYAEGVGDIKVNMRDSFGQVVSSLLKDVHYVPDMGRRAGCDEHRLFNVFKAREADHRIVFEEPSDFIHVHDASRCTLPLGLRV